MSALSYPGNITTLLADDEEIALHRLRQALARYPQLSIIGEVQDGEAAVTFINKEKPALVFLDIQMPGLNGFEVLNKLEHIPLIVFVTAYEEYAIKAFERNSLDYLLKPVEEERLALTIQRIMERRGSHDELLQQLKQLVAEKQTAERITTIPVKTGNKITLLPVKDIYFLEAGDKYVYLHTKDDRKLIEYPLSWLQDRLPPEFIRIHRSYMVNKFQIREIQKYLKGTYAFVMNDQKSTTLKSAVSYTDTIRQKILLP